MKRTTPAQRRKRLAALLSLGLIMTVMVLLMVMDLPDSTSDGISGTMMERGATAFAWRSGAAASTLDEPLTISFGEVPNTFPSSENGWRLVASRSAEFNANDACTLREWMEGDEIPGVDFMMIPRGAECLDAGPWHVFVVGADDSYHKLGGTLMIRNGRSSVELTDVAAAIGHNGAVDFELAVHRPASGDGFDGVFERPVDVWVTNGDEVCVAPAEAVSVPRSAVRTGKSWEDTRLRNRVGLNAFKKVRDYDPFSDDGSVVNSLDVEMRGNCDIEEGTLQVLVGPTERGYAKTAEVHVHAPPARIDISPIIVSVPTGGTEEARFAIRNFSTESTAWSAEPADLSAEDWLIGSHNQTLKGRDRDRGLVSFSAVDLAPGLYTTDIIVRVDDYYGTEVRIPVEMKVLPARASRSTGSFEDDSELPGEFAISNYPNPFSAYTNIRLETRESGQVSVTIYDMSGREIQRLVDEYLSEGTHEFRFQADNLASGSYIYRVVTPSGQKSETMVLVK